HFDWETKYIPLELQKQWAQMGVGTPSVISISFGGFWLATSSGNYGFRGKLPSLSPSEFIKLESQLKLESVEERWIYGDSMGGHNVWQLALRYPEFFSKVATSCSAQMSVSPFQYPYQFGTYAAQSGGWVSWILGATALFRSFYETEAIWLQESPLALLTDFKPPSSTHYMVMAVTDDVYGFTLPNRTIYEALYAKGALIDYSEVRASHCFLPVEPLAKFLSP
ncbi:MAG: alpha/beta hydrolase-fold protein, partial [Bdellovibrionia bacterium]